MQIIQELNADSTQVERATIALGTFDGLHLGHQSIIRTAVRLARQTGGPATVFTFSSHPAQTLDPLHCPPMLLSYEDKVSLLADWGVDILCQVPFSEAFSQLSPENFIAFLQTHFAPTAVVVGSNYTYGRFGSGTCRSLQLAGLENDFRVVVKELVVQNGQTASSTTIRELIAAGRVKTAAALLGRQYHLTGQVVNGDGRGRQLGFPTANVVVPENLLLPGDGVYAVNIVACGKRMAGMASIGSNPTFDIGERRFEIHLLDWEGDLYGCRIVVQFVERLRDMIRFSSPEDLVAQLETDRLQVKALLS